MIDSAIYDKLSRYCAYQERCISDVKTKLYSLKTATGDAEAYLTRLKKDNFVNEERFVKWFIEAHSRKKWGKVKMRSALIQKGIDKALITEYLDRVVEEDYENQLKALAEKKWKSLPSGSEKEKKNKLIRFLLSKGFEMGRILQVIKYREENE